MADAPANAQDKIDDTTDEQDVLVEDILVEEVSIDGMCGVY